MAEVTMSTPQKWGSGWMQYADGVDLTEDQTFPWIDGPCKLIALHWVCTTAITGTPVGFDGHERTSFWPGAPAPYGGTDYWDVGGFNATNLSNQTAFPQASLSSRGRIFMLAGVYDETYHSYVSSGSVRFTYGAGTVSVGVASFCQTWVPL